MLTEAPNCNVDVAIAPAGPTPEGWLVIAGFLILRDNSATVGAAPRQTQRQGLRHPNTGRGTHFLCFEIFIVE